MNEEWLDNILDGEPSGITDTQWLIIENNIYNTSLPSRTIEDIIERLNDLTQLEYERDTRKQWERMFKDGMFKHRDL